MTSKAPTRVEDAHKTSKKAVDFRNLVVGRVTRDHKQKSLHY
jgi:hypothetical protein